MRGISTTWSLSPLHLRFTMKYGVREGSNTHKSTTLAYSTLWRPNGRGLQSTPLKRSKDPLEYHGVLFSFHYPVCKESPQIGVSCPYKYMITNETQSKGGKQHTQIHSKSAHTRPRIELTRLSQSSHLEQSSNHLETQTNAQRLSVDDQECSKVACVSPPCA